nr:calmodulin isoform X2 [Hydra vulgaris]
MSNFSVEELAKFQDVFYKFDENDDGRISLNEAMHAFRLLGFSPNVGEVQEMFTEKESLHKGSLDFPQFILILEKNLKTPDSTEDIIKIRSGVYCNVVSIKKQFKIYFFWLISVNQRKEINYFKL